MSKLTEEQKAAIKAADKPNTQLAKEFGVSAVTVGVDPGPDKQG